MENWGQCVGKGGCSMARWGRAAPEGPPGARLESSASAPTVGGWTQGPPYMPELIPPQKGSSRDISGSSGMHSHPRDLGPTGSPLFSTPARYPAPGSRRHRTCWEPPPNWIGLCFCVSPSRLCACVEGLQRGSAPHPFLGAMDSWLHCHLPEGRCRGKYWPNAYLT